MFIPDSVEVARGRSRQRYASTWKLLLCAFLGGPMSAMIAVPVVRMLYNVPAFIERDLSVESPEASRLIGYVFFIGLAVGVVLLRRLRWRALIGLFFVQVLAFFILMAVYRA